MTASSATAGNVNGNYTAVAVGVGQPLLKSSVGMATVTGMSGKQVNVTLDGFTLDGSSATDGIKVTGDSGATATDYAGTVLTILRSTVTSSPKVGLTTSATCTLYLDQDVVSNNKGGGISIDATDFSLFNLQINGNGKADSSPGAGDGSTFGGVQISSAGETGSMKIANLTVVGNNATSTAFASGILCIKTPTVLFNTVLFGNLGTDITAAQCKPDRSAFSNPMASTNNYSTATCTMASQLFTLSSKGLYNPNPAVTAPCTLTWQGLSPMPATSLIGSGEASFTGVSAPNHDLAGTTRANPPAIGALE